MIESYLLEEPRGLLSTSFKGRASTLCMYQKNQYSFESSNFLTPFQCDILGKCGSAFDLWCGKGEEEHYVYVRTSTNDITGETRGMEGMSWNENTKQKDTFTYYLFLRRCLLGNESPNPGQSEAIKEMIQK